MEMLFELESLFAWCTSHIEINSIFINSSTAYFSEGIEKESLSALNVTQLEKLTLKLQKIIFAMMQLPQTIVVDVAEGAQNLASEFIIGADIRIGKKDIKISFDHGQLGLIPSSGGMSMLSLIFGQANAKNWLLTKDAISDKSLLSTGFLKEIYTLENRQNVISKILNDINEIAPIQRIQSKLGLFESIRPQLESGIMNDRKIAKASYISEDWKKIKHQTEEIESFMPAKSMSYAVKLSLIKGNESGPSLDH